MSKRRAPIERLVDFSVAVPRSVLRATRLSAKAVVQRARHQVSVPEQAGRPLADLPAASVQTGSVAEADPVADSTDLPIDGYDDLAARQVVDRLAALAPDDLASIDAYERSHRNRSTVLGMIARLTA